MGRLRDDGLPYPLDGTQSYLAAILDELRGIRADRVPPAPEGDVVDVKEPEIVVAEHAVEVREPAVEPSVPAAPLRPVLPTPDPAIDGDTVAAAEKASSEATKIRRRQPAHRRRSNKGTTT